MTQEVKKLLHNIKNDEVFKDFYFIGGTALSYYLNHRVSYDLDFISRSKLKVNLLKSLSIKYDAKFIPDSSASTFKVNTGNNIDEYKMMFNFDGIKVEFFYPNDLLRDEIVAKYEKEAVSLGVNVKILPLGAIAELKMLALFRREKIRDLFDIYALLEQCKIRLEELERFYSLQIGKKTLVEFIDSFCDDGTESLDFEKTNSYYDEFSKLGSKEKLDKIKLKLVNLIVNTELDKREMLK